MRGADVMQESLFTYMTLNDFVPTNHPLRSIREIVNTALEAMDATFDAMYADSGRDSIPPEQLLRGLIPQALYGLRSRAAALRESFLQHAVSLVRGPGLGQGPVGPLDLHQEP